MGLSALRSRALLLVGAVAACAMHCTPLAAAEIAADSRLQTVASLQQWNGRIPDGASAAPAIITDQATLEKLWGAWQITAPLPRIDFSKELVLTHVARSSLTKFMGFTLDEKGDLVPQIVATPDMPGFHTYAICRITRAGIRTVRGQPLK